MKDKNFNNFCSEEIKATKDWNEAFVGLKYFMQRIKTCKNTRTILWQNLLRVCNMQFI